MVNKVILIGNIGMEPEIRTLETGVKVARLRVATTERFTNQTGERKEHTEWHTVVLWRSQADFAEKFLHKGTQVFVDGKIRTRERMDEHNYKRTIYEIHAEEIRALGKRESSPVVGESTLGSATSGEASVSQGESGGVGTFGGAYNPQPSKSENEPFANDPLPF